RRGAEGGALRNGACFVWNVPRESIAARLGLSARVGLLTRVTLFAMAAGFGTAVAQPAAQKATQPLSVVQLQPGLYFHRREDNVATRENGGDIANVGFIVGSRCVAVIDTGGTAAEGHALRAAIRAVTPLPVCYVINTHMHPDHIFGNIAFAADHPQFVGSATL